MSEQSVVNGSARWFSAFRDAVKLYGGVRPTARLLGSNPATISRINQGRPIDVPNAQLLGKAIGICPCCGGDWPKETTQS